MARAVSVAEGPLWALVAAAITGAVTLLVQRLRGQTDETVAVMAQWKELLEAHRASADAEIKALKERINAVEKELAEVRDQSSKDMAELRKRHSSEIDEMRKKHRDEMRKMRELNEGLQRMIAQNSRSTAQMIERSAMPDPDSDLVDKLKDEQ